MFEGEKRKEVKLSIEESAKGTLLFYTRHTSRNKMEDKHRKLRITGWKRGQWLDMSMTLLFTRLWRNTLNQIFPTQAQGTHAYHGANGVDESTNMRFFCNDLQLA